MSLCRLPSQSYLGSLLVGLVAVLGLQAIGHAAPAAESASLAAITSSVAASVPSPAASVFGTDDRRIVNNTSTFPWSAIGQVQLAYGYEIYVGTGVMIGRYLALTCGHVVSDPSMGKPDASVFVPGQTRYAEPFGEVRIVEVIPSPQWQAYHDDGYDIAILVLDRPIGDQTGYFQITVQPEPFFNSHPVEAAGYPTDLGGMDMYTISGNTSGIENNVVFHNLDTESGQSGSPIWYGDASKGEARLVALNEGSYLTATPMGTIERGIAARIDQSVANWIDEQLIAHNDNPQNIASTQPVTSIPPTQDPYVSTSICGQGIPLFLPLGLLGWSACLVVRRGRR